MTKWLTTIGLLLILTGALAAQEGTNTAQVSPSGTARTGIGIQPAPSPFSLLDISRITWSHSYSVAFFSGGGTSSQVGMLRTRFDYEISSKLHLAVNLGVLHDPGSIWGSGNSDATLLPGFRLDYRPSEKVMMSLSFQTYQGYYSPYYGRRDYRYSPFMTY